MYKNVQTNHKKFQILTRQSCCYMLILEKNWKQEEATNIVSSTKVTRSLPEPWGSLWEALVCEKLIPKPAPNGTKKFTTACWCHSMIACQVSWISDEFWIYWNLKTKYLNVYRQATVTRCLKFIPISCMGPKHAPKDTYMIFQPILVH